MHNGRKLTYSLAFFSSFSLYLSKTRSDCWVAKNRISCTCAHLFCEARRYGGAPEIIRRKAGVRKLAMAVVLKNNCLLLLSLANSHLQSVQLKSIRYLEKFREWRPHRSDIHPDGFRIGPESEHNASVRYSRHQKLKGIIISCNMLIYCLSIYLYITYIIYTSTA
jgi:hypothetical protein